MAAKTWETDFRREAIQASIRALGDEYHDDPFRYPGSFCLPVGERPVVGWTVGRVGAVTLLVAFGLVGIGVLVDGPGPGIRRTIALCLFGAAMVTFVLPLKLDRFILRRLLGERWQSLSIRPHTGRLMAAELSNAEKAVLQVSLDGDEYVLIAFDDEERRVMMEGTGARYQIRAEDVESIGEFQFMNYSGIEIMYRIDPDTTLRFAMARTSFLEDAIRRMPLLFFLRKLFPSALYKRCLETLRPETS